MELNRIIRKISDETFLYFLGGVLVMAFCVTLSSVLSMFWLFVMIVVGGIALAAIHEMVVRAAAKAVYKELNHHA